MLVFFKNGSSERDREQWLRLAESLGSPVSARDERGSMVLEFGDRFDPEQVATLCAHPAVGLVVPATRPMTRVLRPARPEGTVIRVGERVVGGGGFSIIAGPCAVETEAQLLGAATAVARAGADFLRGGAYKPRTSPYDFQGLGPPGLELLARARERTGLPVITEAVDEDSLERVERFGDVIQIGARNMQNFSLLKRAGQSARPVLLKRGMSARLEDLLLAAEYVLDQGNPNVILCERGIRTFSDHSRYTLDLSIVPVLKEVTHLPVVVDPSHASGRRSSVAPLARAACAVGADGVMVEVHPDPADALCDGPQSLHLDEFAVLARELRELAPLVARRKETVS